MKDDDWDDEPREKKRRRRVVYEAPRPVTRVAFGLGLAALLLSAVALPLGWIPAVGKLHLVIAGAGFLLGLTALLLAAVQREEGLAIPLAGTVVGVAALGV